MYDDYMYILHVLIFIYCIIVHAQSFLHSLKYTVKCGFFIQVKLTVLTICKFMDNSLIHKNHWENSNVEHLISKIN